MSNDVTTQLADYFAYVDEAQGAVDLSAVLKPEPIRLRSVETEPSRQRRWRPVWMAAAAALVTVALIGGAALLSGRDGDTTAVVTQAPTPSTTLAPATTLPPPVQTLRDLEERIFATGHVGLAFAEAGDLRLGEFAPRFSAPIIGGGVFDLAEPRERPLLIGLFADTEGWFDGTGSAENEAVEILEFAFWQYGDRIDVMAVVTGQTADEVAAALPSDHTVLYPIAATDDRPSVEAPGLWSVSDTTAFVLVSAEGNVLGGFGSSLVAEIGPGRGAYAELIGLLVGEVPSEVETTGATPVGYIVGVLSRLSVDVPWRLIEWQILGVDVPAAEASGVDFLAVARLGPPGFLPSDTRIWVSSDTEAWTAVELPETVVTGNTGPFTGPIKVAAGGPGLVAVGVEVYDQDCFRNATLRPTPPGFDSGLTACDGSTPRGSVVWTTPDGLTWTRVAEQPAFEGTYMYSVAAGGGGLVAVGFEHQAGSQNSGDVSGQSVVWTSQDGITWTRLAHDEDVFGQSVMYDVTYGPNGFLAVGWKTTPDWDDPVFWHSIDGLRWNRVDPPVGSQAPMFVGVKDNRYVVATGGGGLYWSPDGVIW